MSTISEIFKKYNKKIDAMDLELIISAVIKKPREFVLAHPEFKLTLYQVSSIKYQVLERIKGKPLAYILGEKEFYGLKFKVDKNVLIPRPETEIMVDCITHIVERITKNKKIIFIDIGTGSGCIIITLAKKILNNELRIMNLAYRQAGYKFIGIDISAPALKIARQNAKLHKVDKKIKFLKGNLLKPILKNKKYIIPNTCLAGRQAEYIILANLPYLTPLQIKNSPSIKHEPKLALDAGQDGLKYYRGLFSQLKKIHNSCYALCEIDPSQTSKIKKIIKTNFPSSEIRAKKDLRGLNRLVIVET